MPACNLRDLAEKTQKLSYLFKLQFLNIFHFRERSILNRSTILEELAYLITMDGGPFDDRSNLLRLRWPRRHRCSQHPSDVGTARWTSRRRFDAHRRTPSQIGFVQQSSAAPSSFSSPPSATTATEGAEGDRIGRDVRAASSGSGCHYFDVDNCDADLDDPPTGSATWQSVEEETGGPDE